MLSKILQVFKDTSTVFYFNKTFNLASYTVNIAKSNFINNGIKTEVSSHLHCYNTYRWLGK